MADLYADIYGGPIAGAGWEAVVTYQQLMGLADKYGRIRLTPESISRMSTVPQVVIEAGIEALVHLKVIKGIDNASYGLEFLDWWNRRSIFLDAHRKHYTANWLRQQKKEEGEAAKQGG